MQITSSDFQNLESIPLKFSHGGENINPSLTFSEIPADAQSLVLIVEDPDAPGGIFTHWILFNMSPATLQIVQGQLPVSGVQGLNDAHQNSYYGPNPPSGTHRYFFKLFALDEMLEFEESSSVDSKKIYEAMDGHIIDKAELIGTFSPDNSF